MNEYDASSIRILRHEEAEKNFAWLRINNLANQYSRTTEFISRGIEACRRASTPVEYFIERYLEGNKDVERIPLVEAAFKEIQDEERELSQRVKRVYV